MAVKTITVTVDAYNTLKSLKSVDESFSEAILRIGKRRPLSEFFGVLSKESGEALERSIKESRKRRNIAHQARMKHIIESFGGV